VAEVLTYKIISIEKLNVSRPITKLSARDDNGNLLPGTKYTFGNKADSRNFNLADDGDGTLLYTKRVQRERIHRLQLFGNTPGRYTASSDYVNIFIVYFYAF
jgi:hypothetical protein